MNIIVFSTKRSTHHAFLENVLSDRDFFYENNLRLVRDSNAGDLYLKPSATEGSEEFSNNFYIASFEMRYKLPEMTKREAFVAKFGDAKKYKKIIYMRDPVNTLASTLSYFYKRKGVFSSKWVESNMLTWVRLHNFIKKDPSNFSFIYANRFWNDEEYKNTISKILGSEGSSFNHVSRFAKGGNSLFGDKKITGDALSSRYQKYLDDPFFIKIVNKNKESFLSFLSDNGESSIISEVERILF